MEGCCNHIFILILVQSLIAYKFLIHEQYRDVSIGIVLIT